MKTILHSGDAYVLRFDEGEELMAGLVEFCAQEKITVASLQVIGAAGEVSLRFYDLETKRYVDQVFREELEITGLIGNVALIQEKPVVHLHGSFGRRDMSTLSGHVQRCVISVTGEAVVTSLDGRMERAPLPGTELNLLV